MNFAEIKVKVPESYNTITFNDKEIKVLKYLPMEEKFDLIMAAIQKSNINGVYNPIRLTTFFALNIVYLYTDIQFDVEERVDEGSLYDNLYISGLLKLILDAIEDSEAEILETLLEETLEAEKAYRNTAAAIINKLVDDMPKNAEAARDIVDNFDQEKYAEILKLMKAIKE